MQIVHGLKKINKAVCLSVYMSVSQFHSFCPSLSLSLFHTHTHTWLPLEIQSQGKVKEFCAGSGKFEILRKVGEIQENPLKVGEI